MSQIGTEKREIYVEPLENPVPQRQPMTTQPKPLEVPQPEPVGVPTR